MSIWYQQPDSFSSDPVGTRRWGFSAIPNTTRSPFSTEDDGTSSRFANAMYGLMPDYARPALDNGNVGDNQTRTTNITQRIGGGGGGFGGMEFTECT